MGKFFTVDVKDAKSGKWFSMGAEFDSEAKAEKYGSELVRDYPEVCTDYMVFWDVR